MVQKTESQGKINQFFSVNIMKGFYFTLNIGIIVILFYDYIILDYRITVICIWYIVNFNNHYEPVSRTEQRLLSLFEISMSASKRC